MQELFKELFDSLPHVKRIWVDANLNASIHPRKDCEVVEREVKAGSAAVETPAENAEVVAVESSEPKKKGKK